MAKRGRPAQFDEPMRAVWTRLPESVHDQLMRLSIQRGVSVHQLVRAFVRKGVEQATNEQECRSMPHNAA